MRILLTLLFALFVFLASAQEASTFKLMDSIKLEQSFAQIMADPSGNIYLLSERQELVKLDEKGNFIANYRERFRGETKLLDCTNPLRILVFYPGGSLAQELDNMLDPKLNFKLDDLDLSSLSLLCRSYDNNYWLYDERSFRLRKYALDLNLVLDGVLLQNILPRDFEPIFLTEQQDKVYLLDSNHGIFVFDLFGRFLKQYHYKGLKVICFDKQKIYLLGTDGLRSLDLQTLESATIKLKLHQEIKSIDVVNGRLYVLKEKTIGVYSNR